MTKKEIYLLALFLIWNYKEQLKIWQTKSILREDVKLDTMLKITENPHTSILVIRRHLDINKSCLWSLDWKTYKPYKIQPHQELLKDDFDLCAEFCAIQCCLFRWNYFWAGIVLDTLIGSFVIDRNLTGDLYEKLSVHCNQIIPATEYHFWENFMVLARLSSSPLFSSSLHFLKWYFSSKMDW